MNLFTSQVEAAYDLRTIALFGVGLIGASISAAVQSQLSLNREVIPFDWNDPTIQAKQIEIIQKKIIDELSQKPHTTFDLVWSAGRAGFAASAQKTTLELENFKRVLLMARRVADHCPNQFRGAHLISSAGGLFVGQRYVTSTSVPAPRSPYGWLKLNQEQMLVDVLEAYCTCIYRLSTVYGMIQPGQRRGLILALIANGVQKKITHITGRMTTLRDFVAVDDVARFILSKLKQTNHPMNNVFMVVSGKPSTIQEIQKIVEDAIKHKLYVNFSLDPSNEQDISFAPTVIPTGWQPSSLRQNIPLIYADALSSGELFLGNN